MVCCLGALTPRAASGLRLSNVLPRHFGNVCRLVSSTGGFASVTVGLLPPRPRLVCVRACAVCLFCVPMYVCPWVFGRTAVSTSSRSLPRGAGLLFWGRLQFVKSLCVLAPLFCSAGVPVVVLPC